MIVSSCFIFYQDLPFFNLVTKWLPFKKPIRLLENPQEETEYSHTAENGYSAADKFHCTLISNPSAIKKREKKKTVNQKFKILQSFWISELSLRKEGEGQKAGKDARGRINYSVLPTP